MGDISRSSLGGLKNWGVTATPVQDFSGTVDSLLFPLVGSIIPIEVRPDRADVSVTNPKFTAHALVKSYKPLGGQMTAPLELVPAKSGANAATLVRSTS